MHKNKTMVLWVVAIALMVAAVVCGCVLTAKKTKQRVWGQSAEAVVLMAEAPYGDSESITPSASDTVDTHDDATDKSASIAPTVQPGEEGEPTASGKESWQAYFEREWLDKLVNALSVVAGAVCTVAVMMSKVKRTEGDIGKTLDTLQKHNAVLVDSSKQYQEAEAVYQKTVAALSDLMRQITQAEQGAAVWQEGVQAKMDKLTEAVKLGLCNKEELVKNGCAKAIAKVLGVQHETE